MSDDEDFMMSDGDAESYEFEFEDDDDAENDQDMSMDGGDGDDDEQSAVSLYYKAKNQKQEGDIDSAIATFRAIRDISTDPDDSELWEYKFKACKQIIKILYKSERYSEFINQLGELFSLPFGKLQKNYVSDSFSKMIDNYSGLDTPTLLQFYDLFLDNYTGSDRLTLRTTMKKVQLLLEAGRLDEVFKILELIHQKLSQMPEMTQNAYLLELYALEIQAYTEVNDVPKLKELYGKTHAVQSTIPHPRINAVIKECGGKIQMREEQYGEAAEQLFESFKNYDEIGNQKKRVKLLQYLIVASILADSKINKYDSQEAKYFLKQADVMKFLKFRDTFDSLDHTSFTKMYTSLCESEKDDAFMVENLSKVRDILKLRTLVNYIRPFKRLSLEKLSRTLNISVDTIEDTFLSLRNNGEIPNVRLDLVDGIIYNV